MGGLVSVLSNLFNNHPALMIGTITLTEMGLDPITLKTIYLANIIGSDMGSLLLPIGTLASLIWMHILRKNKIKVTWKDYLSVSLIVIPISTIVTLTLLFFWVQLVFAKLRFEYMSKTLITEAIYRKYFHYSNYCTTDYS